MTIPKDTKITSVIKRGIYLGVAVVLVLLAEHSFGSDATFTKASGRPPNPRSFPLWKAVPSKSFATLGDGMLHGTHWAVYAYNGVKGKESRHKPCLVVAHITRNGAYGSSTECGPLAPSLGSSVPPVYTLFSTSYRYGSHGPQIGETFIGMSIRANIANVIIEVEPGASITRSTRYLSEAQSKKAHLVRFRYLAVALNREVCVRRIVAKDLIGNSVVNADTGECPLITRRQSRTGEIGRALPHHGFTDPRS